MNEREILTGWKAIEEFIGMRREAIIRLGFPVRKLNKQVMANKADLLRFIDSCPTVKGASGKGEGA